MNSSGDDIGTTHVRSDMGCPNSMGGFGAGKALVPRSKTDKPCPIGHELSQLDTGLGGPETLHSCSKVDKPCPIGHELSQINAGLGGPEILHSRSKVDKPCPIGQEVSQGEQAGGAMNRREGGTGIYYVMEYLMELENGDLYDYKQPSGIDHARLGQDPTPGRSLRAQPSRLYKFGHYELFELTEEVIGIVKGDAK